MIGDLWRTLFFEHDALHVALALAICLSGSVLSALMLRAFAGAEPRRQGHWAGLLSVIAGGTIWTTHIVAMHGFRPDLQSGYSAWPVALSLFIMVAGVLVAARLAASPGVPRARDLGGLVLGGSIAAMHHVGMAGFALPCGLSTNGATVALSVAVACLGGVLTFRLGLRGHPVAAAAALAGTTLLLHFLGIAALTLDLARPLPLPEGFEPGDGITLPAVMVMGLVLLVGVSSLEILRLSAEDGAARLRRAERHDLLTGLPNRAGLDEALGLLRRPDGRMAPHLMMVVDLDEFRHLNDRFGQDAGDSVLALTAQRLRSWLPPGSTLARIAGDTFAVVVSGRFWPAQATRMAQEVVTVLSQPAALDGRQVPVACSVGAILCPAQAQTLPELLAGADLALAHSKRRGRRRASLFEPDLARHLREQRRLADDLARAIAAGELELYYQPQCDTASGEVTGFEALMRWNHPELGLLSPDVFIPMAEERGLIAELGAWALRTALEEAQSWARPCRVAVNVTATQFEGGGLAGLVRGLLAETGFAAHRLELEITESMVIEDLAAARRQLAELRAVGLSLAMDDYGTGQSALSMLLALPFDKIKFDKSFVQMIESDPRMICVLRSTADLGRRIGMKVLVEGVETEAQARMLAEIGFDQFQGFLIGRPMSAGEVRARFDLGCDADTDALLEAAE